MPNNWIPTELSLELGSFLENFSKINLKQKYKSIDYHINKKEDKYKIF